ncbi:MAG TPA: DUF4019 domain-containing protein [Gammaproteobacteria bacterium]|nr:DUF4019 domain-containing protein [Gammaproteobacteria bacterium]
MSRPASVLLTLVLVGCDSPATTRHEEAARAAAEQWLERSDGGDHAGTWDVAAPVFKVRIRKEQWETRQATSNRQLGIPDRRELIAVKHTTSVPGLDRGDYVVIQYRRSVWSVKTVVETLVMERTGEGWRIAEYHILPSDVLPSAR